MSEQENKNLPEDSQTLEQQQAEKSYVSLWRTLQYFVEQYHQLEDETEKFLLFNFIKQLALWIILLTSIVGGGAILSGRNSDNHSYVQLHLEPLATPLPGRMSEPRVWPVLVDENGVRVSGDIFPNNPLLTYNNETLFSQVERQPSLTGEYPYLIMGNTVGMGGSGLEMLNLLEGTKQRLLDGGVMGVRMNDARNILVAFPVRVMNQPVGPTIMFARSDIGEWYRTEDVTDMNMPLEFSSGNYTIGYFDENNVYHWIYLPDGTEYLITPKNMDVIDFSHFIPREGEPGFYAQQNNLTSWDLANIVLVDAEGNITTLVEGIQSEKNFQLFENDRLIMYSDDLVAGPYKLTVQDLQTGEKKSLGRVIDYDVFITTGGTQVVVYRERDPNRGDEEPLQVSYDLKELFHLDQE